MVPGSCRSKLNPNLSPRFRGRAQKHDGCWTNAASTLNGGSTNSNSGSGSGGSSNTGVGGKDSGCDGGSSHSSDYKPDIKAGSSESDYSIASTNIADSTLDFKAMRRNGSVPLAEPIELPLNYR